MLGSEQLTALVRDDPRNNFELRENKLIKSLFREVKDNKKAQLATIDLIYNYRAEFTRLHFLTRSVASLQD